MIPTTTHTETRCALHAILQTIMKIIFILVFAYWGLGGDIMAQFVQHYSAVPHQCTHHCALAKTKDLSIGIYEQDERVHHYDVHFYGLNLTVNPSGTSIGGSARVVATLTADQVRYFVLEATHELSISKVIFGHSEVAFSHTNNNLEIDLGSNLPVGTLIDLEVFYTGEPQPQGFFAGIQSEENSFGDPVLWTLSEPHNARQWFPVKQVLNDKADSVYVFISTPPGFIAASNGMLQQITELDNGNLRYEWKSWYPIAYYLISMAVSNYQEFSFMAPLAHGNDSVWVQNFLYNHPQELEAQRENLLKTQPLMQLLSELWGNYPFSSEKYGHAQAPMGGAMEHQTMSTMGYFGFDITAHELAHHWFGNNVTCATWSDIWINEGFATYAEYLSREFIIGSESASQWMTNVHSNVKSAPGGSVYVPAVLLHDIFRIFNGRLSYRKGAAILHQLRFEINDDPLFFQVMEQFQSFFADSVASGDDFMMIANQLTGRDWSWFFDQWYYGEGFPVFELKWWQQDDRLYIRSAQSTTADHPSFFAGTLEFNIITETGDHSLRVFQEENLQEFDIPMDEEVIDVIFDPRNFMLKNYTILDSASVDTLPQEEWLIFPNPFSEVFTIHFPDSWHNGEYFLYDLQGKLLMNNTLNTQSHNPDTEHLLPGIYILRIFSPRGETKSFRVIKY